MPFHTWVEYTELSPSRDNSEVNGRFGPKPHELGQSKSLLSLDEEVRLKYIAVR